MLVSSDESKWNLKERLKETPFRIQKYSLRIGTEEISMCREQSTAGTDDKYILEKLQALLSVEAEANGYPMLTVSWYSILIICPIMMKQLTREVELQSQLP